MMGSSYSGGQGVKQDYAEAIKWYRKSADQGYANALSKLGGCYAAVREWRKDYHEAGKNITGRRGLIWGMLRATQARFKL